MADYAISNVPRRVVYTASGVGPYAFTFEILAETDIDVYEGDDLLTLTTDYTVTINANGTGSVTLVTSAADNITIVGAKSIQRTTDFTTGGDFFANTLNNELDAQTIFIQQVAETAERGLKAPVTDPTDVNMTLPRKADRANKFLAFDSVGDPVPGETPPELIIINNNIGYVQTVGADLGGSGFSYDLGSVSDAATGVPAGTPDGYIVGVYNALDDIATVEADIPTIEAVAAISTEITTLAGISADIVLAAQIDAADLSTVADASADVTTVATNIASVNTAASDIASIIQVANDLNEAVSEIDVVANNIASVQTVGTNITNINTVAGISADVTTVAGDSADIQLLADNIATITTKANAGANSDITSMTAVTSITSTTSLTLASGGTNQNITLDPSGTGVVSVVSDLEVTGTLDCGSIA